ncbi:MAG: HlyD family secretion protein [Reyranellaceae bacterium]
MKSRFLLMGLALAAGIVAAAWVLFSGGRYVETDNAYVKAVRIQISPEISGRVAAVLVEENQLVEQGAELFRIDDEPLRIAMARADAELALIRDQIDAMRAALRQNLEEQKQEAANVEYAEREFKRQSSLVASRVAAEARLDEARTRLDVATQRVAVLKQEAGKLLADLSGDPGIKAEDHPRYRMALQGRNQMALDLRRSVVHAPARGIVGRLDQIRTGGYVRAGTPALNLVGVDEVWIEANLKESQLTRVREGQPVTFTVDAYPGVQWKGKVESLSPATGAEFSILPPQNATGNWVKVVQRLPVRLSIQPDAAKPPLRMGMSAIVSIDTGEGGAAAQPPLSSPQRR